MSSTQDEQLAYTASKETGGNTARNMNNYPFLVHSQESLSQQNGPNVDNQRLVRQKRRRTSPEDQAILEAEFDQNSRPDKATRMEIVKKVALGEKEVQIWFQNRRQVTRRRSRPLLPHEILANLRTTSRSSSERVPSSSSSRDDSSQQWQPSSQSSMLVPQSQSLTFGNESPSCASQVVGTEEYQLLCQADTSNPGMNSEPLATKTSQIGDTEVEKATSIDMNNDGRGIRQSGGLLRSLSQAISKRRRPELGKRRNSSFIIHDEEGQTYQQSADDITRKDAEKSIYSENALGSSHALGRTSSLIRLSMSIEGKAQVTTSTGTTPSPPRPQLVHYPDPGRRPSSILQRSFSAVEPTQRDYITSPAIRRPATGRSRDARTWEFYCDKDARDALTEQAEREESGSATAVIALIKSNSNISRAVSNKSNKRNAHGHKVEAAKRLKATEGTGQRLKLSRSQSSLANMQTVSSTVNPETEDSWGAHPKQGSKSVIFEPNEGDSDKENWVPGTQQRSPSRQRPAHLSHSQRRVLAESLRHSSSLGALMSQEKDSARRFSSLKAASSSASSGMSEKENEGSNAVKVVSLDSDGVLPREADDLDCVQNLLSLSQAAWR